jgi:hypothetical protein
MQLRHLVEAKDLKPLYVWYLWIKRTDPSIKNPDMLSVNEVAQKLLENAWDAKMSEIRQKLAEYQLDEVSDNQALDRAVRRFHGLMPSRNARTPRAVTSKKLNVVKRPAKSSTKNRVSRGAKEEVSNAR